MDRLLVEAPDPDSAILLIDELKEVHSKLLPGEGGRFEVHVKLGDGHGRQIDGALAAVQRWLAATGMEAAKVKLNDRSYVREGRAGPFPGGHDERNRSQVTSSWRRATPADCVMRSGS